MSDVVTISLITVAGGILSLIITKLFELISHVKTVDRKVDEYHKEVNGHMTELLKLKKAEGKEEQWVETEAEGNPV